MTRHRIEPRSPGPLANILPTRPMSRYRQYKLIWINRLRCAFRNVPIWIVFIFNTILSFFEWFSQYVNIFDYQIKWVKLATLVEGDLKAPFSIATTSRCKGGCCSFAWVSPLIPTLYCWVFKQGGIKYHFLSLWYDATQVSRAIGEHSNHHANSSP